MKSLLLNIRILICRLREKPDFILQIINGNVSLKTGYTQFEFVRDCQEIINRNNIQLGFIYVTYNEFGVPVIKASSEIPQQIVQQLRNVWNF